MSWTEQDFYGCSLDFLDELAREFRRQNKK